MDNQLSIFSWLSLNKTSVLSSFSRNFQYKENPEVTKSIKNVYYNLLRLKVDTPTEYIVEDSETPEL